MTQQRISRRAMLKGILAAGGALGASAFLPEKWLKPMIKTGVLPVHAQTSINYMITAFQGPGYLGAYVYIQASGVTESNDPQVSLPTCPGTPVNGVTVTASVVQNNGSVHISITSDNPQVTGNDGSDGWVDFTVDPGDGGKLRFTAQSGVYDELTLSAA